MEDFVEILKATFEDLSEILELQKLAYLSEAQLLNDFSIKPITQTLEEFQTEFIKYDKGIILKLINENNEIIGSVRAHEENNRILIGRLIVHPDYQKMGIGKGLMGRILKYLKEIAIDENKILVNLITDDSKIGFYEKLGFKKNVGMRIKIGKNSPNST